MATKIIRQTLLIWFLTNLMVGCTVTTNHNKGGNSIPVGWVLAVPHTPKECVSIDGDYKTFGEGQFKEGEELTRTRLDAALGYAFPSEKIPEHVGISVEQETSTLNLHFSHPVNRNFSTRIICSNGWYLFEEELTNQYLGDGTDLDRSISKIELGKSEDGDLILHLLLDIQSSSFLVLKSRDVSETWSKYKETQNKK